MEKKTRRIGMCIFGLIVCGTSVGFFKLSVFGVDPFQVFLNGLNYAIPISFGILYIIVNIILLMFSLIFDRHYIGLGTLINLFLMGYIIDFSEKTLIALFPNIDLTGRIIAITIGIILICFGAAFYYVADLGVSTYDAIPLIISNTWKLAPFKYVRIISDFICVIFGSLFIILVGGSISDILQILGVGTLILASAMGPLIDFLIRHVAQPFYDR